jgi:nucleotide-binding universal stress UspA family protein
MLFATLEGLSGVDLLPFGQVAPELTRLLEPTADRLRERGFAASIAIRDGEAAGELIRTAGDRNVDLIALSTRGRRGVARLLLGSTARRVVQHAPCPVLTVRQPEA